MADKATQTEWSCLQHQIAQSQPVENQEASQEKTYTTDNEDVTKDASTSAQEDDKSGCTEPIERDAMVSGSSDRATRSRVVSAVRYSDESRLFQTSPEFDEFVAMLTEVQSDDEEEEEDEEEEKGKETDEGGVESEADLLPCTPPPPPYPPISSTNLPWPTILQYLRESESLSSEYFSCSRPRPQPNREDTSHDTTTASEGIAKHGGGPQCFFCDQRAHIISLLPNENGEREVSALL